MLFILPDNFFTVKMDSSYFEPLISSFGNQQGPIYQITTRITWVVSCYRTIGRLRKFAKSFKSSSKPIPQEKKKIE